MPTTTPNWASKGIVIATGTLLFALSGCAPSALRDEASSIRDYYRTHDKPEFQFSRHGALNLRYVESGDPEKPAVVFLHGTPGDWTFLASYVNEPTLQSEAHLIAVDRPGWGGSTFDNGAFEPGIEAQSRLMGDWLCDVAAASATGGVILVGHSFGGTLAPRLAMDHPDCVDAVIILASPLDPALASPRWYNRVARVPPFGWLADVTLGGGMRQSNKEMMILKSELENMRPLWAQLDQAVIVMQGGKDGLVDPHHADFVERMLPPESRSIIRLPNEGHFFLYSKKDLVLQQILSLLQPGTCTTHSTLGNIDGKPTL